MNLRWVHAVLIMLSAALAALFGVWSMHEYGVVTAMVAFAVSLGLVFYDSWFLRKTKRLR
jgi:hypothetical protein